MEQRLPGVEAVDPRLRAVFGEVPVALGVPFVPLIFRRLARWPDYLHDVWARTRPVLATASFAEASARLGWSAEPALDVDAAVIVPPDIGELDLERARTLTQVYAYVQPKLLLLTAGWAAGLALPAGPALRAHGAAVPPPDGWASDVDLPPPVAADAPSAGGLLEEMARRRQQPGLADYYRRLATWPSLLAVCWGFLEPLTASAEYVERSVRLAAAATSAATSLGLTEAGAVGPVGDRELVELVTGWRHVQVPPLMLDTRILGRALAAARAPER